MSNNLAFIFEYDENNITLRAPSGKNSLFGKLLGQKPNLSINELSSSDKDIVLAFGDLRFTAEEVGGHLEISDNWIKMDHSIAASLDSRTAEILGLPDLIDLTFYTDVEGIPGQDIFRLRHNWLKYGEKQSVSRTGSILNTSGGVRRLPKWLMDAVILSEHFKLGGSLDDHWNALAKFRQALEPEFAADDISKNTIEMSEFLKGLKVKVADGFSILPYDTQFDQDYEVVPFAQKKLREYHDNGNSDTSVDMAELEGRELKEFQNRVRKIGVLPSYKVADRSFLVVDKSASTALRVMVEMYEKTLPERMEFIRNPRRLITEAIAEDLQKSGVLNDLTEAQQEEMIEQAAFPLFVETLEYSKRVTGKIVYTGNDVGSVENSGTTWLPEIFGDEVAQIIKGLSVSELESIEKQIISAFETGAETIDISGEIIPATPVTAQAIRTQINVLLSSSDDVISDTDSDDSDESDAPLTGPIILDVTNNTEQLKWSAGITPRHVSISRNTPADIKTSLKDHQVASLAWQIKAWESGLPGVLNADEQGLGKTLQTLTFLRWIRSQLSTSEHTSTKGPILIVAPTSLLENWEQEVRTHMAEDGLGQLIRLYGNSISGRKVVGATGRDTTAGNELLDLNFLRSATEKGQGHNFWVLTTYTTLTNYQHSLGRIPFSVAVFDEIQALKNPGSLRALAGMAMNADFRIGLTGTPIENSTTDLWAILEQLCPGRLVPLSDFRKKYETPDKDHLEILYKVVFGENSGLPPMALRRLKDDVAKDLPAKIRMLHPRVMPLEQALAYEDARYKLASGQRGAALKMLHHIRTVSVHPSITSNHTPDDFINLSGRLKSTFDIIDGIYQKQDRVLVFIEHVQMQFRFIELLKARYNLKNVDLINGATPISKRQDIVNRFQTHLKADGGFDVLVLGPKAAGTGLTLTAATNVIHLSRWWNPAVEEQCNDRVHRIGQTREVTVHVPMSIHPNYQHQSFDCLLHSLMARKRKLASSALWPMGDTSEDTAQLQKMLAQEASATATSTPVEAAIAKMFERDGLKPKQKLDDQTYIYD